MFKFYRDYYWKHGLPYGQNPLTVGAGGEAFKVVMDPYRKRVTLERYENGVFKQVDYDSQWLDFRHLKPEHQMRWQREVLEEKEQSVTALIRDHDDRVILKEITLFENEFCRECRVMTPLDLSISVHRMSYKKLNDPFDGVTLYDNNKRAVMRKLYEFDEDTKSFAELLKEDWDFSHA